LQTGSGKNGLEEPCETDSDCDEFEFCDGGPAIALSNIGRLEGLQSATLTELTLIPCSQDFENQLPSSVNFQFTIYNEFEQKLSASTTITCWKNFFLFQVNSPFDPPNSPFAIGQLGSTAAMTVIEPTVPHGGMIGVAGVLRADRDGNIARTLLNLHIEGDRFSAQGIEDRIILPEP
jgi:hypothetical protein